MNQVLDEIGIEVKGKMDSAPTAGSSSLAGKTCYTNSPFKKAHNSCNALSLLSRLLFIV